MDPGFKRRLIEETVTVVDHYQALEVLGTADETIIKKAYRKLVLKWHPDKQPTADREVAEVKIRSINEAYEVLSNSTKREAYDQQLQSVQRRRQTGARVQSTICVKTDLPRECIMQPIGHPDKFVRYVVYRRGELVPGCVVQSRAEARAEGESMLDEFGPYFNATKLSLWWLPGKGNMCRIRAVTISKDEFFGTPLKSDQAGGLNFAFRVDDGDNPMDSDVKLMEAARGAGNEMVNFNVEPSPYYENTYRFESALRKGHFLAYRPPQGFKVVPHVDGSLTKSSAIVDFTVIPFAYVFKFIDIEEVLKIAVQHVEWITLDRLKMDSNVAAYFRDILGRPMWNDEDFQTYFEGHSGTWAFNVDSVRYRKPEERISSDVLTVSVPSQVAQLICKAGATSLSKLSWQAARHAFRVLSMPGSDDLAFMVDCMTAKRNLIGALALIIQNTHPSGTTGRPLSALVGLADEVHRLPVNSNLAQARSQAEEAIVRNILQQLAWAERKSAPALDLDMREFAVLLTLPGIAEKGDVLAAIMAPHFATASMVDLLPVVEAANAEKVSAVLKGSMAVVLESCSKGEASDVSLAIRKFVSIGLAEKECLDLLMRRATTMAVGDIAPCIAAFAEKGASAADLSYAVASLASRGSLSELSPDVLLALAVGGTKSEALSALLGGVAEAAAATLAAFSIGDVIRFLLATAKAKGGPVPESSRSALFKKATEILTPAFPTLSTVEIIKVGLAAGGDAGRKGLLNAVARQAETRFADIQPAQLILLTQALVPLDGGHESVERLVDRWIQLLDPEDWETAGSNGLPNGDQLVKLAQVFGPTLQALRRDRRDRLLAALGNKIASRWEDLSSQSKDVIEKQLNDGAGLGIWRDRQKLSRFFSQSVQQEQKGRRDEQSRRALSPSPAKRKESSPPRRKESSPPRRREPSPARRREPSPPKRKEISPSRRREPSPAKRRRSRTRSRSFRRGRNR